MKKVFGARLREARGDRSQQEIADLLGEKQQTYGRWENGKCEPGFEMLHRICVLFGRSADWLIGLTDVCAGVPFSSGGSESLVNSEGRPCPDCLKKNAVIADQALALREMTIELSRRGVPLGMGNAGGGKIRRTARVGQRA